MRAAVVWWGCGRTRCVRARNCRKCAAGAWCELGGLLAGARRMDYGCAVLRGSGVKDPGWLRLRVAASVRTSWFTAGA